MLQSFTWHHFLMLSLIFIVVWYAGVIFYFYRNKGLTQWKNHSPKTPIPEPLPHKWEKGVDALPPKQKSLAGKALQPEGLSTLSAAEFRFAPQPEDRELQQGMIPDVLEELKDIFSWIQDEDGSKQDFFIRWNELKTAFPKILQTPRKSEIQSFISNHAPFFMDKEELESLWY